MVPCSGIRVARSADSELHAVGPANEKAQLKIHGIQVALATSCSEGPTKCQARCVGQAQLTDAFVEYRMHV